MKQTASNSEPHRATPNHNWTQEKLTEYVKECFISRDDMNEQLAFIGRRSSVELFRAGYALHLLRDKLKVTGGWEQCLKDNSIPKVTAFEAIRLYYKAKKLWKDAAESEVGKMTITAAKVKLGVIKEKQKTKSGVPGKPKDKGEKESGGQPKEPLPKVDTMLVIIAKKLTDVSEWDRSDLDPERLDKLARQCIKLLGSFLLKKTVPMKKTPKTRKVQHAA